jgi:hypothetical protein
MLRRRRIIAGLSAVLLLGGGFALALEGYPVMKDTLRGRWEAIDDDDPRIFVLTINEGNDSVVAMTYGAPGRFGTVVYRSTSLVVRNGAFVLEANSDHGRLVVRGRGETLRDWGNMDGEILLHPPAKNSEPTRFRVHYRKRPGGYANWLKEMADLADKATTASHCDGGTNP